VFEVMTEGRKGMTRLSLQEVRYLTSQSIGRIATVSLDCQPHVNPVEFRFNADLGAIDVPGIDRESKKYHDLKASPRAGFVVDDIPVDNPESPRGVCIRGSARSSRMAVSFIRTEPAERGSGSSRRVVSWGLDG
jgi:pyridoxamine 5'-phosphate oxidase family protein